MNFDNDFPITPPRQLPLIRKALLGLLISFVVLAAHGGSYRGEFVFDDIGSVVENASIHQFSSLSKILTGGDYTTVAGRPLLNLSLAFNYAMGGLHTEGYHLVNYLIHAANAFLLMSLLRRLFEMFVETRSAAVPLAVAISLLWSIHPLTINGVSYICQRAESMVSFFYLAVLWAFVKGVQTSQRRWFVLSVVAAWLGGLTKEVIATAPLTVIALDLLVVSRDWQKALRQHWKLYLTLMSSWVPLGICMWASKSRDGTVGFGMLTLPDHLQTQVWAVARYLRLAVWPQSLVFDYGDRFVVSDLSQVIMAAVVIVAFVVFVVWLLFRRSPLAFIGVMPSLVLAPTTVIPIATQTVAEHRMYLASACLITALVLSGYLALTRLSRLVSATSTIRSATFTVAWGIVATILYLVTTCHTRIFASAESLWDDTVQKRPANQRAVYSLASAKFNAKHDDKTARRLCDQVINMPGRYVANAYELRGRILERQGEHRQAIDDFSASIALHPSGKYVVVGAYEHRAQLYGEQREYQKAIDDFSKAIDLRPNVPRYYCQRAITFREMRQYDESLRDLDKAEELDRFNVNTKLVRASVEVARGDHEQALQCFDQLLAIEPAHVGARQRRAWVYAQLSRWSDAMREIRQLQGEGQRINSKLIEQVKQNLASRTP